MNCKSCNKIIRDEEKFHIVDETEIYCNQCLVVEDGFLILSLMGLKNPCGIATYNNKDEYIKWLKEKLDYLEKAVIKSPNKKEEYFKKYEETSEKLNELEKTDNVNNPNHYKIKGLDIEVIDIMRAGMTKVEFVGHCKGNVIKYITRARKKNGLEDLKKARVYLNWALEEKEEHDYRVDRKVFSEIQNRLHIPWSVLIASLTVGFSKEQRDIFDDLFHHVLSNRFNGAINLLDRFIEIEEGESNGKMEA